MSVYYLKKYPYVYSFRDADGIGYTMHTIDIPTQMCLFMSRVGCAPRSFFDCGAATGELVDEATKLGMVASGIEIAPEKYQIPENNQKYFDSGIIHVGSILDSGPVYADLAYCNGTLTYMTEKTLPRALAKFKTVGMLIAIHNTVEDIIASFHCGEPIMHEEPRLIRPKSWWMNVFKENGFSVSYDEKYNCFCALPIRKNASYRVMDKFRGMSNFGRGRTFAR